MGAWILLNRCPRLMLVAEAAAVQRAGAADDRGGRSHAPCASADLSFHGLAAYASPYLPRLYRWKTRDSRLCSNNLLCTQAKILSECNVVTAKNKLKMGVDTGVYQQFLKTGVDTV